MASIRTTTKYLWVLCWAAAAASRHEKEMESVRSAIVHTNYLIKSWIHKWKTWAKLTNTGTGKNGVSRIDSAHCTSPHQVGRRKSGASCCQCNQGTKWPFDSFSPLCEINSNQSQFTVEIISDHKVHVFKLSMRVCVSQVEWRSSPLSHYMQMNRMFEFFNAPFFRFFFGYSRETTRENGRRNKLCTIGIITDMHYILLHIL